MPTCCFAFRRWASTVNVSIDCSMKTMLNVELHVQRASLLLNYIFCFFFFFWHGDTFSFFASHSLSLSSLCTLIVSSYEHTTRFCLFLFAHFLFLSFSYLLVSLSQWGRLINKERKHSPLHTCNVLHRCRSITLLGLFGLKLWCLSRVLEEDEPSKVPVRQLNETNSLPTANADQYSSVPRRLIQVVLALERTDARRTELFWFESLDDGL